MKWPETADANRTFWEKDTCYIAESPHRPGDADGLAEFAAGSESTRSLLYFQVSRYEDVPKWVGITREAFLHSARAVNQHLKATPQDRWLMTLPFRDVGAFAILARCHASGASYTGMEGEWHPTQFMHACRNERITLASLTPSQVCELAQGHPRAPSTLRAVVVGGGASTAGYYQAAMTLGWPLLHSYGREDACFPIAMNPLAQLLHIGFDPGDLEVLPGWNLETNRNGLLYVRGATLAAGYATKRDWRKRHWIAEDVKLGMSPVDRGHPLWRWEPIDPDSGIITRDHVELWSEGDRNGLRYLGRGASLVKIRGEMVNLDALHPRLEGLAIAARLGFGQVVIFPMPDNHDGNRLVLVGQVPMEALEALRARYNKQVAGLEKVHESRSVPDIPRTDLGRVDSVEMMRMLAAAAEGGGG